MLWSQDRIKTRGIDNLEQVLDLERCLLISKIEVALSKDH